TCPPSPVSGRAPSVDAVTDPATTRPPRAPREAAAPRRINPRSGAALRRTPTGGACLGTRPAGRRLVGVVGFERVAVEHVEPAEDDALPQRPRAELERRDAQRAHRR